MGLFDFIKDLFDKEDKTENVDYEALKKQENELMDSLSELEKQYNDTLTPPPKAEDVLGDEIIFEYLTPDDTSDDEIISSIEDKYEKEQAEGKESIEKEHLAEQNEILTEKDTEIAKSEREKEEDESGRRAAQEERLIDVIDSGIVNSTINEGMERRIDDASQKEQHKISAELSEKLSAIDGSIASLQAEQEKAIKEYDLDYAEKIENEIAKLIKERDDSVQHTTKYNNDLKLKEDRYKEDRREDIQEYYENLEKEKREQEEYEAKYGYEGDKKTNYDKRFATALDFYGTLPKDVAIELITKNNHLQRYLGHNYARFVTRIRSK